MRTFATILALALLTRPLAPAYALDASCGMTVPPGETAVLQADLACTGTAIAITLETKATLDLNGFTLGVDEDMLGVYCTHLACRVISSAVAPGVIEGGGVGYYGIIANLQPSDSPPVRKLVLDYVAVRNFEYVGVYGARFGKSHLNRVEISGCGAPGIIATAMILTDVTVNGNGLQPGASGDGIVATKIAGTGVTTNGNADRGIYAQNGMVKITGLTATGNGTAGVEAHAVKLVDGQLSGNATLDIRSERRPRLKNTTCDHSNWDVCSLD